MKASNLKNIDKSMNYSQEIEKIREDVEGSYDLRTPIADAFDELLTLAKKMQDEIAKKNRTIINMAEDLKVSEDSDEVMFKALAKAGELEFRLKRFDWIPCSERLPEEDGVYLGQLKDNDIKVVGRVMGYWIDRVHGYEDGVIAWMPLPEPWSGEV